MSTQIFNRDFQHPSDGWYNIEAKGSFPNARASLVQIIDDAACAAIVTAFNREADAPGFAGSSNPTDFTVIPAGDGGMAENAIELKPRRNHGLSGYDSPYAQTSRLRNTDFSNRL
jgi:hypothetical protein